MSFPHLNPVTCSREKVRDWGLFWSPHFLPSEVTRRWEESYLQSSEDFRREHEDFLQERGSPGACLIQSGMSARPLGHL